MEFNERYTILALGGVWGVFQGLVVWNIPLGVDTCISCASGDIYFSAIVGFAIILSIGVAAMVGYMVDDFRATIYCLFLAQAISVVFYLTSSQNSLLLVGLGLFLFFVGLVFGVGGASLRERFYPRSQFGVRWVPLLIAIITQSFTVMISIWLLQSLSLNWLGYSENLYLELAMPILLAMGVSAVVFGLISKGHASTLVAGGLIIAAFVVLGLTFVSINVVDQVLAIWTNASGADQGQVLAQFQVAIWCLYPSLVVPILVLLRIAFAREDRS